MKAAWRPAARTGPRIRPRHARGTRFAIQPGSAAAKAEPPLVMAVELVETSVRRGFDTLNQTVPQPPNTDP